MCHFITAVLPVADPSSHFRRLVAEHRLLFEPTTNPSVEAQLHAGEHYFRATGHWCDCGTGLGAGAESTDERALEKRVAKLRHRGWGKAKIARWLEQQASNERRLSRKRQSGANTPTAEEWHRFLYGVLAPGGIARVGLLLHMYSGDFLTEEIRFSREAVPLSKLTPELLRGIREDVLYEFRGLV